MHKARRQASSRVADFLAHPRRALWTLSLPILGGQVIHTFYSIVDMIFVGWVGPDAVTALAFNVPLVFFAMGMTMGLSSGVTAVVAQALGGRDKARADNTAEHAVVLGLAIGAPLVVIGLTWGPQLLSVLGARGDVSVLAWSYFQVICWGMIFSTLSAFFRGILAGEGDTLRPMLIMGMGMVLNIILDPVFIFAFGLGVRGAAYATVISQLIVFSTFVYLIFLRRSTFVQFRLRYFQFKTAILVAIFQIGVPASISFVFMSMGQGIYNKILSSFSQYAVAAYQIAGRVEMIYFMPVIAIATGVVTLAGMFYGAGEYGRLREIVRYAIQWAVVIGLVAVVLIYPSAPVIMQIFKPSDEILAYGVNYLRIIVLIFPFVPIGVISGRVMQGLGKGLPFMVLSFLRVIAIGTPLAAIFTYVFEKPIEWVWFAMISGGLVSMVVGLIWLGASLRQAERRPRPDKVLKEAPEPALKGAA
ncbi:MAG: MATE family efflux transporter [Candidatus Neomarinimicrobiota bacterium]